ncbi:MAG TPA: FAD binding domain-containing protein [Candidatus Thermoplasmatota archaeon]|nr:FAD binding domain-containing protein [Candidatus Thermoplasmatota archaeon]
MSMLLPPFELHEPTTLREALRLKAEHPDSDWIAGGTDLLPNYKWGLNARRHVISLGRVAELREIGPERIGAGARLVEIERHAGLAAALPVIPETAKLVASPLIRASATLGGNLLLDNRCYFFNQTHTWRESKGFCKKADGDACLVVPQKEKCYATFSADLPAPLIALGASFEIASVSGTREVPAAAFYEPDGIHRNQRRPDEMLVRVKIPASAQRFKATYAKLRQRESFDFPELGIAAAIRLDHGKLAEFRLVANALETVPVVLDRLGEPHLGKPFGAEAIDAIAKAVEENVRPVKNTSLLPSYRKSMSRVFTRRALRQLAGLAPS